MTDVVDLPIDQIIAGNNDRTVFAEQPLRELAASIAQDGLAQPVTVRPLGPDRYELVAGERRYRAMKLLDRLMIPALVRPLTDEEASRIMLTENLGRVDLNPLEEAKSFRSRIERFGITEAEVAQWASKSPEYVRSRLDLLTLRDDVQAMVASGQLGPSSARCLVGLDANRQGIVMQWLNSIDGMPTVTTLRQKCGVLREQQMDEEGELAMRIEDAPDPNAHLPLGRISAKLATEIPHGDDRLPAFQPARNVFTGLRQYQERLVEHGLTAEAEVVGSVILGLLRANIISNR